MEEKDQETKSVIDIVAVETATVTVAVVIVVIITAMTVVAVVNVQIETKDLLPPPPCDAAFVNHSLAFVNDCSTP